MKILLKLLLLMPLLLQLLLPATGSAQFTFTTNNGALTITGYNGPSRTVVIPSSTNGLPVTSIGVAAFSQNSSLTSVTIPGSVTTIGQQAFYSCSGLTNVTLGSGVANLGAQAFTLCSNLPSLTLPNSVTNIGGNAFQDCYSLTKIALGSGVSNISFNAFIDCTSLRALMVDPANSFYSSTNGVLFNKNQTALVQFPGGVGGSYTIPKSVTSIGYDAFVSCAKLTAILVETNNLYFASAAGVLFNNNLTTLIRYPGGLAGNCLISNTANNIGDYAFRGSPGLTGVTIPDSVTAIGTGAFYNCPGLTNVTIPNGITSILPYTFYGCSGLSNATIGSNVTSIGTSAFFLANNLTVWFLGNAPTVYYPFTGSPIFYYLPGTMGWDTPLLGQPTILWLPQIQTGDAGFGVRTNQFGFNFSWAGGRTVVVEAATDLVNPVWTPLSTNTLTAGLTYFSDSQWTNSPGRFYRLRSP